jgi:hypothetical protein
MPEAFRRMHRREVFNGLSNVVRYAPPGPFVEEWVVLNYQERMVVFLWDSPG